MDSQKLHHPKHADVTEAAISKAETFASALKKNDSQR
jgi:hypothetical protein